ncbi:SRPBCC family protein [Sphingosinicella sp.]|uniref:SRPBCC family protein n=1 Tax=Sphingosinicella sp. TaxID=1917971 RepID=UPI0017EF3956|nr:SRPBCC family protein [Sphingosinicella sp.]MBA4758361.1 SRPBCC family protein [Sphingosinicella sp.]
MTSNLFPFTPDPTLDLVLDREIDVPVELVWEAWTSPESIKEWFCPKPWSVSSCEIDLRPGGRFNTVMRSPEGDEFPNSGCYLEVVPNKRLVFTDTLLPGFRPSPKPFFTAALLLEPTATGTRYTAIAIHGNEETRKQHEEMGFHDGWGTVVDQLVAHIKASMH